MKLIEGICEYFYDLFKVCLSKPFEGGTLPIEYEKTKVIDHKIYNSQWFLPLNDFKISALFLDLSEDENKNWILLLENNNIIFIFKYLDGEYQIIDKNNKKVTLEVLGNLISSFEKMINLGFSWKPQKMDSNLFNIVQNFI